METFDRRYLLRTSVLSFAYLCGVTPKLVSRSQTSGRTLQWNAFTDLLESAASLITLPFKNTSQPISRGYEAF